jgi:hypothetical protein
VQYDVQVALVPLDQLQQILLGAAAVVAGLAAFDGRRCVLQHLQ